MGMEKNSRNAAITALLKVKENEGYSNIVIDKTLKEFELDKRDSALASAIFYGVLEKKITLDYLINKSLSNPDKKLNSQIKTIIRCGVYQIFYMDKVPESAIVNEAVNSTKQLNLHPLAGLVNAVLRNLIRQKENINLPQGEDVNSLSIRYSIPSNLINLWIKSYGKEITFTLLESISVKPKTFIRVNTTKTENLELQSKLIDEGINAKTLEYPSGCIEISGYGSIAELDSFKNGLFHVQDISSQILCDLISPKQKETIYDVCAAPGGKSFTIAEMMKNNGDVFSCDLYRGRVKLIKSGAERLGLSSIKAIKKDASTAHKEKEIADKVLCDVPCSGYGVIRKKPEIRYKSLDSVAELPNIQYNILENTSQLVKPGGLLVYSTCTLNPAENNDIANKFLEKNKNFEIESIILPDTIKRAIDEPANQLTLFPFTAGSDGFFISFFRKKRN